MNPIRRQSCIGLLSLGAALVPAAGIAQAPAAAPAPQPVIVTLETTAGAIVLELDAKAAPRTVANFVQYVKDGFYSGTIFHRVIPGFMIQGGGFTSGMVQKATRAPIAIESDNGLKNVRGTIAMARTMDPNSATAQFFINVVDNPMLDFPARDDAGYTVFGQVIGGMDVVETIRTGDDRHARRHARRAGDAGRHQEGASGPLAAPRRQRIGARIQGLSSGDPQHGKTAYEPRRHRHRTRRRKCPQDRRELPPVRALGPLRQHGVPSRHQRLHDPGRRLRARHAAEAHRRADRQRGRPTA